MPSRHQLDPETDPVSIPRGWVRMRTGERVTKGCRIYLGRWQWCCTDRPKGYSFLLIRAHTDRYTYLRRAKA